MFDELNKSGISVSEKTRVRIKATGQTGRVVSYANYGSEGKLPILGIVLDNNPREVREYHLGDVEVIRRTEDTPMPTLVLV